MEKAAQSDEKINGDDADTKAKPMMNNSHRRWCFVGAAGALGILIVLALSLGLGLGLGLKARNGQGALVATPSGSMIATPTSTEAPSNTPAAPQPWRRDTLDYNLDLSWNISASPTTRIYNLTVSEIQAAPDGVLRTVLAINGQFPGPLIRANRGDRILANVTNQLTNATSMHWHGLFQNGTNWMDGTTGITQCPIPPGESFLYNFTVENQYGTYWYHSHYSTQYTDGIVGPFIVHAPEEAEIQKSYDFDQIILIQDWYHDLSASLLPGYLGPGNENVEPVPDNGLIQGTNYFNCSSYGDDSGYTCQDNSTTATFTVEQNKRYRLRLINTGAFAEFQVSVDNHTLSVVEVDATQVTPTTVNRLAIHIAQRYSVILTANQTATNYWIRAQMNTFCFSNPNPVLDADVRALLTYTNTTTTPSNSADWSTALQPACEDLDASTLIPTVVDQPPPPTAMYLIDVSFQIGAYTLDRAYINSTTWMPLADPTLNQVVAGLQKDNASFTTSGLSSAFDPSQFVVSIPDYQVVDLLIYSLDEGAHPFHLHGHVFWIMQQGAGAFDWAAYQAGLNVTNPLRRDTLTVEAYGWSLIRFRADNPGLWAFHCHIAWHMEAGLLMQFQSRSDLMKEWTIPADVLGLCGN